MHPTSFEFFEIIMDRLEKEWFQLVRPSDPFTYRSQCFSTDRFPIQCIITESEQAIDHTGRQSGGH